MLQEKNFEICASIFSHSRAITYTGIRYKSKMEGRAEFVSFNASGQA